MRLSSFKNIINEIRQWGYPRAFRISSTTDRSDDEKINDLIQLLSEIVKSFDSPEFQYSLRSQTAADDEPFIADLSTRLWRIQQNLKKPNSNVPIDGIERGYRHLDRLFSVLEQLGIRIVERTGEIYDPGMAIEVVSSEPIDGIDHKIIKETIEPAVYRGDRLIRTSKVVVGIPSMNKSNISPGAQSASETKAGSEQESNLDGIPKEAQDEASRESE